jgi:hypothetical protein
MMDPSVDRLVSVSDKKRERVRSSGGASEPGSTCGARLSDRPPARLHARTSTTHAGLEGSNDGLNAGLVVLVAGTSSPPPKRLMEEPPPGACITRVVGRLMDMLVLLSVDMVEGRLGGLV